MVGGKDTVQQLDFQEPRPEGERNSPRSCNKAVSEAKQGAHLLSAVWSSRKMRCTVCVWIPLGRPVVILAREVSGGIGVLKYGLLQWSQSAVLAGKEYGRVVWDTPLWL